MYLFVIIGFILDMMIIRVDLYLSNIQRFILGLLLFGPSIIQLWKKVDNRLLKFSLRATLGLSIWFILSFVFFTNNLFLRLGGILGFGLGVMIYSNYQQKNKYIICDRCKYDQNYDTCLIRFQHILAVDNLEYLAGDDEVLTNLLALRSRAKHSDAIILPTKEIN